MLDTYCGYPFLKNGGCIIPAGITGEKSCIHWHVKESKGKFTTEWFWERRYNMFNLLGLLLSTLWCHILYTRAALSLT